MTETIQRLNATLEGRYRIKRELGTGGMATVYLAEDLRHDRNVALKVLKPELTAVLGGDRFIQEIKTTASLQHPHILPLFDSGTANGFLFYVMPYIEGETLREKLDRETQLGIAEAVRIAREVADALDYAHRNGVIHRDIKPENILLHDGRPVVADFGIALAVSAAAGGRMTETGTSLGTPHYMSPEQATADRELTSRSDIYSLGAVLYEMLAGEPPHMANVAQQVIMKIITDVPRPVSELRKSVPPNVAAAVSKALEKLPADRFDSAKAFADALVDPAFTTAVVTGSRAAAAAPRRSAWTFALATVSIIATAVAAWALTRPPPPGPVIRYEVALPADPALSPNRLSPTLTSDGSRIIYRGQTRRTGGRRPTPGEWQLQVKRRDRLEPEPLPGTAGVTAVAVSPDGGSLAIVQDGHLRKMPIDGGALVDLADSVSDGNGNLAWLDDATLLYMPAAYADLVRGRGGIMQVRDNGGGAKLVWSSDSVYPQNLSPLPDGRALFMACAPPCDSGNLFALDPDRGEVREIMAGAVAGYYADGILVFVRSNGDVFAVPFDADVLETRGDPVAMPYNAPSPGGVPELAVSASGTLVIGQGAAGQFGPQELVWVDRAGRETPVDSTWIFRVTQFAGDYGWALSPDGTRLAIGINTPSGDDVWIKSLPRGPASLLTHNSGPDRRPRWTRDGRWVTFVSDGTIAMRRADDVGADSILWTGPADEGLLSPDGQWLLLRRGATSASAGGRDIFAMRIGVDSVPMPLLAEPYDEMAMALSPDGRRIAYQSDETGRLEIFVRPFPNVGDGKAQVSSAGGTGPLWSRDGRELFYLRRDNTMMAVPVGSDGAARPGESTELFQRSIALSGFVGDWYTPWDVASDGRFIMVRAVESEATAGHSMVVVENWLREVKAMLSR